VKHVQSNAKQWQNELQYQLRIPTFRFNLTASSSVMKFSDALKVGSKAERWARQVFDAGSFQKEGAKREQRI